MHLSLYFGCALEDIRAGRDFSHWPWYNTQKDFAPFVLEEQGLHPGFGAIKKSKKFLPKSDEIKDEDDGVQRLKKAPCSVLYGLFDKHVPVMSCKME